jgi:glycosyltransferase involved in cell wall biosynthesis
MMLSIVSATFNREQMLSRLKESIDIPYDCFEWIIIDDGSTDNTESFVNQWIGSGVPISYQRQQNQGRAVALNKGIRMAKGKYIMLMDDDDWFVENMLQGLLTTLEQEVEGTELIGAIYDCVNQDGDLIGTPLSYSELNAANFVELRADYKIVGDKKEVIKASHLVSVLQEPYPGERRVPTSLFWTRCAKFGKVRVLSQPLIYKTYHPEGMTDLLRTKKLKTVRANMDLYRQVISDYRKTYSSFSYFLKSIVKLLTAKIRFS